MAFDNPLLQYRLTKIVPHVIDTLLLASAITMLVILHLSPLAQPWLLAKIIALLLYIVLGMVALRFGSTKKVRVIAWGLALLAAGYMLSVAYSKNPWGFLAEFVLRG